MLTTSVSLPKLEAHTWRRHRRAIMAMAIRTLRLTMRTTGVRRGVKRHYNRQEGDFRIVTTRFTEAEYDTLHCAAAAMRVSVSWLVFQMIRLWLKPSRRHRGNRHVTNYYFDCLKWNSNAGVVSESIFIWPKSRRNTPWNKPASRQIPDNFIHFA